MEITREQLLVKLNEHQIALTNCKADLDAHAGAIRTIQMLLEHLDTPAPVNQPKEK